MPDLLAEIARQYPAIGRHRFTLRRGQGPGQLEFFPAWEERNPTPGEHTIEIRNPALTGQALQDAIAGDALHLLGAVDPRTGKAVDPAFRALKEQFLGTLTPEQVAVDRRVYGESGDPRPFEQWMERSRGDAYLRGYLFPDAADEWRRQGVYTPEQQGLLERIRRYLREGVLLPSSSFGVPAGRTR